MNTRSIPNEVTDSPEYSSLFKEESRQENESVGRPGASLRRAHSEGHKQSLNVERRRRTIFSNYWCKDSYSLVSEKVEVTSSPIHVSKSPNTTKYRRCKDIDTSTFSPPTRQKESLPDHFTTIDEYPKWFELLVNNILPPLPSPLLRQYSDNGVLPGGVYPLIKPRSILRSASYGSNTSSNEGIGSKLETTKNKTDNEEIENSLSPTSSATFNETFNSVKFDPRITVTEFDDSKRDWFSARELSTFKVEANMVAQRYMLSHPNVAQRYAKGTADPILGKVRRRALYANPVFKADADHDVSASQMDANDAISQLFKFEIQRILIVDSKRSPLALLARGMQELFLHAKIVTTTSCENALKLWSLENRMRNDIADGRCFDIVIVKERQSPQHRKNCPNLMDHAKEETKKESDNRRKQIGDDCLKNCDDQLSTSAIKTVAAAATKVHTNMSASKLLKEISVFKCKRNNAHLSSSESVASSEYATSDEYNERVHCEPLMIGIASERFEMIEERSHFLRENADIVWSKYPASIDVNLKNQLLLAILKKRHRPLVKMFIKSVRKGK